MWWLVLIGVLAGAFVAVHLASKHRPTTYSASAQVLVDSTERPFLRTAITQTTQPQTGRTRVKKIRGTGATVTTTTPSAPAQSTQEQPNTQILVQTANLLPVLATSDPVTALRTKLYGAIPGKVTSKALYANNGAVRFTLSQFPIVEVDTTSKTSADAEKLANTTALALRHWVTQNQRQANVPRAQRVVLRPLLTAKVAVAQKHSRLGLAVLVGAAVLAVFYALAVGLDLLIPSRRRKQQPTKAAEEDAPAVPSAEA
jgi:hypothetical protein